MATVDDLMREAAEVVARLGPANAYRATEEGAVLVDTRCDADRAAEGIIPGSVHAPRTVLEWRADANSEFTDARLCDGSRLIVMCNDGYSSLLAAANLHRLGHADVADVVGGFRAWKAAGLPVEG